MRLLIAIPVMLIMAIAGYNFYEEIITPDKYYMAMALHGTVALMCGAISWALVRSAFTSEYTEASETAIA